FTHRTRTGTALGCLRLLVHRRARCRRRERERRGRDEVETGGGVQRTERDDGATGAQPLTEVGHAGIAIVDLTRNTGNARLPTTGKPTLVRLTGGARLRQVVHVEAALRHRALGIGGARCFRSGPDGYPTRCRWVRVAGVGVHDDRAGGTSRGELDERLDL